MIFPETFVPFLLPAVPFIAIYVSFEAVIFVVTGGACARDDSNNASEGN